MGAAFGAEKPPFTGRENISCALFVVAATFCLVVVPPFTVGALDVAVGGNSVAVPEEAPKSKLSSNPDSNEKLETVCAAPLDELLPNASSKLLRPLLSLLAALTGVLIKVNPES